MKGEIFSHKVGGNEKLFLCLSEPILDSDGDFMVIGIVDGYGEYISKVDSYFLKPLLVPRYLLNIPNIFKNYMD